MASSSALTLDMPRTWRGPIATLVSTERWGKRLKLWNTMPVSLRIAWMLRISMVNSVPSTTMRPPSCSSRRLIQRISVDLPDPEGPITTTTSCLPTWKLTFFRAWNSLKCLSTFSRVTIASLLDRPPDIFVASVNTVLFIVDPLPGVFLVSDFLYSSHTSQPKTATQQKLGIHICIPGLRSHPV